MPIEQRFIDGTVHDSAQALPELERELFSPSRQRLNNEVLPFQFALFGEDARPMNQANLTDIRTRMGVLLEYELGKVIGGLLRDAGHVDYYLTYVIANAFPDLAVRGPRGQIGVRFEVKAVEDIAEEKAANFDTVIKDIRKGTDFLVVLLWGWKKHADEARDVLHPHVQAIYVMDAYELAQIRDCYWLNTPPATVGKGRQGFDLCFGVHCVEGTFSEEEGNYGKLMRLFDKEVKQYLPTSLQNSRTFSTYLTFQDATIRAGLNVIGPRVAGAVRGKTHIANLSNPSGPCILYLVEREINQKKARVLIVGGPTIPEKKADLMQPMKDHQAEQALFFNGKFGWSVYRPDGTKAHGGDKPAEAVEWAERY